MTARSLADVLSGVDDPVRYFRNLDPGESIWSFPGEPYDFPDERTHWIEEMRAWRESVVLADQSYHMVNLAVEGPDALRLFRDLALNDFSSFETAPPPQAKQLVVCAPNGYLIGDSILFYLDEDRYLSVGTALAHNWLRFHAETGDYDVTAEVVYHPIRPGEPRDFRFQVQGPNATALLEAVTDDPLPEIRFFRMDTISIAGHEVYALGHGMAGEPGMELFGPYEHHDKLRERLLEAGAEHGIRQLGSKSYKNANIESGWIPHYVPGIYDDPATREYREWLDADGYEATLSIGGSYDAYDIADYYVDPVALGYDRVLDLDHDFVGRDAVASLVEAPTRTKVTLVWDADDVVDVYASLFREGEPSQYLDFPDTAMSRCDTVYDAVLADGDVVGVSKTPGYDYNERGMLSLAVLDRAHAEPGTQLSLVWGDGSEKTVVERHAQAEIGVTVAPCPIVDRRTTI